MAVNQRLKIGAENRYAEQVIDRNVEKALNLGGMQVHRQNPVRAGGGDHIRDQLCGDRLAGAGFSVLAGIAEIRDYRVDAAGGGTLQRVDHNQQFHQIVIDRIAGGLHDENVGAADGFLKRNRNLSIRKMPDRALAERDADIFRDVCASLGQAFPAKILMSLP